MSRMKIRSLLLLLMLACSSIIAIETGFVAAVKPSTLEFVAVYIDSSYEVPTSYSIDAYSGANVTNPRHLIENGSIEITIKNPDCLDQLYYNIRVKGHYSEDWKVLFSYQEYSPRPSNSGYTTLVFASRGGDFFQGHGSTMLYAPEGQLDIQVQAYVGYYTSNGDTSTPLGSSWYFTTERGDWSSTQTLTIGGVGIATAQPTATPTAPPPTLAPTQQSSIPTEDPTATPLQPYTAGGVSLGIEWRDLAIVILVIVVTILASVVVFWGIKKR